MSCRDTVLNSDSSVPFVIDSLLPVLQGCVRHHRPVRQEDGQHADIFLWGAARLLHHAVLPHRNGKPVCDPAAA